MSSIVLCSNDELSLGLRSDTVAAAGDIMVRDSAANFWTGGADGEKDSWAASEEPAWADLSPICGFDDPAKATALARESSFPFVLGVRDSSVAGVWDAGVWDFAAFESTNVNR